MAQKTNPTSLRLRINRKFDSFWYSSHFYPELFGRDLNIRKHFRKIFGQTKKRSLTRVGYTGNSKEQKVLLYWARPLKTEKRNKPSFWRRRRSVDKIGDQPTTFSFPTKGSSVLESPYVNKISTHDMKEKAKILRLFGILLSSSLVGPKSKKEMYAQIIGALSQRNKRSSNRFSELDLQQAFRSIKSNASRGQIEGKGGFKRIKEQPSLQETRRKLVESLESSFANKFEKNLRKNFGVQSSVLPSILNNPYLSAEGISEVIKNDLKKRIFFKRTFGTIKRETQNLLKSGHIKGIRVLISGRLGRQEKAKKASLYIGRTSLNTFNQKIDYSSTSALTKYGLIGIKVWISL